MRLSHVLLLLGVAFLVTSSPGIEASTENVNCATTSTTMEGPGSTNACAGYCHAKFKGSGTCFPKGCRCSFCRDIPPATGN